MSDSQFTPDSPIGADGYPADTVEQAGNDGTRGKMSESAHTLAHVLEHRRLTMDEVLTWASAIAAELTALHQHGRGHGGIAAGSVWFEGNSVRLTPPAEAVADQPRDIAQFAALLRQMLESVQVETEPARAQWGALDRIATTNSHAGSGSTMKRVSSTLNLLCSARRMPAAARTPSPEPLREPEPPSDGRRFLLLAHEVPPAVSANPRRFVAKTIHVWAFLVSAAGIAVVGCLLFLHFTS